MDIKEACTSIAANLRNLADLLELIDVHGDVDLITDEECGQKHTAETAIEYLSILATADKKAKIKEIKALINKYGFQKLPQLKTASQQVIDEIMKEAEVIAGAAK